MSVPFNIITSSDQAEGGRKVLGLPAFSVIHKGHHSIVLDLGGGRRKVSIYFSSFQIPDNDIICRHKDFQILVLAIFCMHHRNADSFQSPTGNISMRRLTGSSKYLVANLGLAIPHTAPSQTTIIPRILNSLHPLPRVNQRQVQMMTRILHLRPLSRLLYDLFSNK